MSMIDLNGPVVYIKKKPIKDGRICFIKDDIDHIYKIKLDEEIVMVINGKEKDLLYSYYICSNKLSIFEKIAKTFTEFTGSFYIKEDALLKISPEFYTRDFFSEFSLLNSEVVSEKDLYSSMEEAEKGEEISYTFRFFNYD